LTFFLVQNRKKRCYRFSGRIKRASWKRGFQYRLRSYVNKQEKTDDKEHSTPYTLLDLDYDIWDVVERLKELTVAEYSETKIDKDDLNPPLLFVFGKDINDKLVYIKLKIKGDERRHVLCVSFHYARETMIFPYA